MREKEDEGKRGGEDKWKREIVRKKASEKERSGERGGDRGEARELRAGVYWASLPSEVT